MSLSTVPVEILTEILAYALDAHHSPSVVLCVNSTFLGLGHPLLHAHLRFRSLTHLIRFAEGAIPLARNPRTLEISLAGGSAIFEVFRHLANALQRILHSIRTRANVSSSTSHFQPEHDAPSRGVNGPVHDGITQVPLELLSFRLHSHTSNPYLSYIYEALSLAKWVPRPLLTALTVANSKPRTRTIAHGSSFGRGLIPSTTSLSR